MTRQRTYTLDEIEQETGFDKRTIAYYVQEELLPKVGRRGPRTRYSQSYLDRLLFIRIIRELQDQGQLGSVTLGDIRAIFDEESDQGIADIVAGRKPLESVLADGASLPGGETMASPHRRVEAMRFARPHHWESAMGKVAKLSTPPTFEAISSLNAPAPENDDQDAVLLDLDSGPPVLELREIGEPVPSWAPSPKPGSADLETIARLIRSLSEAAGQGGRGRRRSSEHWTRARITPGMSISVRNLNEQDAPLLERLALELRRLIGTS